MNTRPEGVRLDKWLWAARFWKTRSLATQAVEGGHVEVNGQRPKPAREIHIGDRITLTRGEERLSVIVTGLSDRRGPASAAQQLYQETPDSAAAREAAREQRHYAWEPAAGRHGRPTKKQRRHLDDLGRP